MESALPTRGMDAVLCVCPSAGHLATKQKRGKPTCKRVEPGPPGGDTPPEGRRCHVIGPLTTEKLWEDT